MLQLVPPVPTPKGIASLAALLPERLLNERILIDHLSRRLAQRYPVAPTPGGDTNPLAFAASIRYFESEEFTRPLGSLLRSVKRSRPRTR